MLRIRLSRKIRVVQRLIPHIFSETFYFKKRKAGYSACSLLSLKEKHGFLKKLRRIVKQAAWNEVGK
jgi:hypothetical protein